MGWYSGNPRSLGENAARVKKKSVEEMDVLREENVRPNRKVEVEEKRRRRRVSGLKFGYTRSGHLSMHSVYISFA